MIKKLPKALMMALMLFQTTHARLPLHKIPKDNEVLKTFVTGNPHESIQSDEINVLVWNMYKGKNKSWEEDFKTLSADKNIIIAQEMFLNKRMTNVFENYGDFEYSTATSFFVWGKNRTGVATISDTQVLSRKFLRSSAREPIVKTPKVVLVTKHKLINDQVLLVANIHAVNFVAKQNLKDQLEQVAEEIRQHKGPVVFAGDFNVWSDKKTKLMRNIMKEHGLIEVLFDKENDDRMTFNKHKLDYIFYRDLDLVSSEVLGDVRGADHKPLVARFRIKN